MIICWQSANFYLKTIFVSNYGIRERGFWSYIFLELFIVLFWLFTYITLIKLQYWSNMRNTISFTIKIILNSQNKIDCVPHLIFAPIYQQCNLHTYIFKTNEIERFIKSCLVYLAFNNRNGLHYKVNILFFFISQVKIYCLNVSIFYHQNKIPQMEGCQLDLGDRH